MVGNIAGMPVGGNTNRIGLSPVLAGAGAYAAGKAVGPLLSFTGAGLMGANSGIVAHARLLDQIGQNATLDLYLFAASIAAIADQAAWSVSKADSLKIIDKITFPAASYVAIPGGAQTMCVVPGLSIPYLLTGDGTILYGQLVATGAPTYSGVDNLHIALGLLAD